MRKPLLAIVNSKYLFVYTSLIWWGLFYPGFYSGDSFGALDQAKSGDISNIYTSAWPLTLKIITLGGRVPGLATLTCVLVLSYSVTFFCRLALPKSSGKLAGALLLMTPVVGAMGITLWHDIPMTAGLLLILSIVIKTKIFQDRLSKSDLTHVILGSILAAYRPNGLVTIIVFFVLIFLIKRSRRVLVVGSLVILVSLTFSVLTTWAVAQKSLMNSVYAQEWMRSDIACTWAMKPEVISQTTQNKMEQIAPLSHWKNAAGCTFLNGLQFSSEQVNQSTELVPSIWLQVFGSDPLGVLKTHVTRNAYLLPIPTSRAMHPPFLHSTIEYSDRGISFAQPRIVEAFRPYVRAWNGLRPITAFAGLWIAVLLLMAIFMKRSRPSTVPALAMSVALGGILFAFAPIPDGRYALPILIVSQALALGFALDFFFRKRGQKQL